MIGCYRDHSALFQRHTQRGSGRDKLKFVRLTFDDNWSHFVCFVENSSEPAFSLEGTIQRARSNENTNL